MAPARKSLGMLLALAVALGSLGGFAGQAAAKSVIDEILERGKLVVGLTTFVPWSMRDKKGELIGFEIDDVLVASTFTEVDPAETHEFEVACSGDSQGRAKGVIVPGPTVFVANGTNRDRIAALFRR